MNYKITLNKNPYQGIKKTINFNNDDENFLEFTNIENADNFYIYDYYNYKIITIDNKFLKIKSIDDIYVLYLSKGIDDSIYWIFEGNNESFIWINKKYIDMCVIASPLLTLSNIKNYDIYRSCFSVR